MTFIIDLTPKEEERLVAGAMQRGLAPAEYLKRLVTDHLPQGIEMTFAELLAPAHQHSREQEESDEELGAFADSEVATYRIQHRATPNPLTHE